MTIKLTVCAGVVMAMLVIVSGCKPDKLEIEVYTSDIKKAESEVVEVPLTATFSIMGEDDDGVLPKASVVAKVLSQSLQIANLLNNGGVFSDIAGKYIEIGQKKQAAEILSQALKAAKSIDAEDAYDKADVLSDIAVKYAKADIQPSKKDKSILSDIIRATDPISPL